jgi:hypothetical protein
MIGMPVELSAPSALAGRLGLVTVSPGLLEAIPTDAIARALRCHGNATGARLETRHSYAMKEGSSESARRWAE